MKLNIFIEGVPGSGKTTLMNKLENSLDYKFLYEGAYSPVDLAWCSYMDSNSFNELLSKYNDLHDEIIMNTHTEDDYFITCYTKIKTDNFKFYDDFSRWEIYGGRKELEPFKEIILKRLNKFNEFGYVFECSLYQNIVDELMLFFEMSKEEILEFYKGIKASLNINNMMLITIKNSDLAKDVNKVVNERGLTNPNGSWFQVMKEYINNSPYGKKNPVNEISDLVRYFNDRILIQEYLTKNLFKNNSIEILSKNYNLDELIKTIHTFEEK